MAGVLIAGALVGGLILDALLHKDGDTKVKISVNVLTEEITKVINNASTFVNKYVRADQNITFTVGETGHVTCVPPDVNFINQAITGDIKFFTTITNDTATNIKAMVEANIKDSLDQTSKEVKDFLSGPAGGDVVGSIVNNITTKIETEITNNSIISIAEQYVFKQNAAITINGTYEGPCTIDQDIMVRIVSNTIANNIINVVSEASDITNIANALKQTSDRESGGIGDFFKKAFEGLGSTMKYVVIGLVIIAIIGVIGGIIYLKMKGGLPGGGGAGGFMKIKNPAFVGSPSTTSASKT
uniref:Uncharacterized protein n=1 Tax=viral metagenome TaxID=1070528 RepID=A0A6C0LXH2_9ZZZZ